MARGHRRIYVPPHDYRAARHSQYESRFTRKPMTPDEVTDAWLGEANERYRHLQIPPIGRPFKALSELSTKSGPIAFDLPVAAKVFSWFQANTKPGSHSIGAMFSGAFFFDACSLGR